MEKIVKILTLALCLCSTSVVFAQLNWVLKNGGIGSSPVENNARYLLVNQTNNSPLKYGKRSKASRAASCINIVWGGSTEKLSNKNFINVVRQPGATGAIKTGEKVALRFEGGGYLNYEKRPVGVNLAWVSSAIKDVPYIWEIRLRENKLNQIVTTNTPFAIFNTRNNDWLAYCQRTDPGINLGWITSCSNCERNFDDWAKDYSPEISTIKAVINEVLKHFPDAADLGTWCVRR